MSEPRSVSSEGPAKEEGLAAMTASVEALQDSARLDWIESRIHGTGKVLSVAGSCYWAVMIGRKRIGEGGDLREAIDDAMEMPDV